MADEPLPTPADGPEASGNDPSGMRQVTSAEHEAIRAAILDLVRGHRFVNGVPPEVIAEVVGSAASEPLLEAIRAEAVALANSGRIQIMRKGRAADPNDFSGAYTMSMPWDKDKGPQNAYS